MNLNWLNNNTINMTWEELRNRINQMSDEEMKSDVIAWGEAMAISPCELEVAKDDMMYCVDWGDEGCMEASDIPDEEKADCVLVLEKGKSFLRVD